MLRTFTIMFLAFAVFLPFSSSTAGAWNWPWSKKPEVRQSHAIYPAPDQKSAKKIKKERKKKAKRLAERKKQRGTYKP